MKKKLPIKELESQEMRTDLLLKAEKEILEMIANAIPLKEILTLVALTYEANADNAICSILLLNKEGTHLFHGAAPSLPKGFNNAIDGEPIGPVAGSCGTAAFRKERVIVSDIATDPLWVNYREVALKHGLKACWSTPIPGTENNVLGTFAIYYREPCKPTANDLKLIDRLLHLVVVVLNCNYKDAHLKESEAKYRTLIEKASDSIFIADESLRFLDVNNKACSLLGYTKVELLQLSVPDIVMPESNSSNQEELKKTVASMEEQKLKRKDGTIVETERNGTVLPNGNYMVIVRDISQRKKAEAKLAQSEKRFRALVEHNDGIITLLDENLKTIFRSSSNARITGWTFEESEELNSIDFIHPDDVDIVKATIAKAMLNPGKAISHSARIRHKNGAYISVRGIVKNMLHDPAIGGIITNMMDVTDYKKSQQRLIDSEEKYRTLVEQATDGIFIADHEGRFLTVNPAACMIAQYTEEEMLTKTIYDLTLIEDVTKNPFQFEKLKSDKPTHAEQPMKRKDGTIIDVEINAKQISDGRLLVFVRDISERKKAEEKIRSSEEQYRDIVDHISDLICTHDLNGRILSVNKTAQKIIGREFNPQDNFNIKDILTPDNVKEFQHYIEGIKKNGHAQGIMHVQSRSGKIHTWEFNNSLKKNEGQDPIVRGYARDITEQKKAEKAILQLNKQLEQRVKERTAELETANKDLEEINDLFVGNEQQIIELKEEIKQLKARLK